MLMGQVNKKMSPNGSPRAHSFRRPHDDVYHTNRLARMENQALTINKQQYNVARKISAGNFSDVYAARRRSDNKSVAVKVVSLATENTTEAATIMRSILNEIEMTKRLAQTSKHFIHMYDFDFHRHTGLSFLVMELGQQDLEKYLSERSAVTPIERKSIWRQLVNIALILHQHKIVHLNITPNNLVLFSQNLIKLVDLGMAKKIHQARNGLTGTSPYSAPEVAVAERAPKPTTTTKADIWSWGAVLYRMTYMKPPDQNPPCHRPPENQRSAHDSHLLSVLRHTLVIDPQERPDAVWLAKHPYAKTT